MAESYEPSSLAAQFAVEVVPSWFATTVLPSVFAAFASDNASGDAPLVGLPVVHVSVEDSSELTSVLLYDAAPQLSSDQVLMFPRPSSLVLVSVHVPSSRVLRVSTAYALISVCVAVCPPGRASVHVSPSERPVVSTIPILSSGGSARIGYRMFSMPTVSTTWTRCPSRIS